MIYHHLLLHLLYLIVMNYFAADKVNTIFTTFPPNQMELRQRKFYLIHSSMKYDVNNRSMNDTLRLNEYYRGRLEWQVLNLHSQKWKVVECAKFLL